VRKQHGDRASNGVANQIDDRRMNVGVDECANMLDLRRERDLIKWGGSMLAIAQ
jgi:hypothetical protein